MDFLTSLASRGQPVNRFNVLPTPQVGSLDKLTLNSEQGRVFAQKKIEDALQGNLFQRLATTRAGVPGSDYATFAEALIQGLTDEEKQQLPAIKDQLAEKAKETARTAKTPSLLGDSGIQPKGTPFERKLVMEQLRGRMGDIDRVFDVATEERLPEIRYEGNSNIANKQGQDSILAMLQGLGNRITPSLRG